MATTNYKNADRIMESLDGLEHAKAPDYFYTRLIGRMQQPWVPVRKASVLLRPAVIATVLSMILLINIASLILLNKNEYKASATIESFADAYDLNPTSSY